MSDDTKSAELHRYGATNNDNYKENTKIQALELVEAELTDSNEQNWGTRSKDHCHNIVCATEETAPSPTRKKVANKKARPRIPQLTTSDV